MTVGFECRPVVPLLAWAATKSYRSYVSDSTQDVLTSTHVSQKWNAIDSHNATAYVWVSWWINCTWSNSGDRFNVFAAARCSKPPLTRTFTNTCVRLSIWLSVSFVSSRFVFLLRLFLIVFRCLPSTHARHAHHAHTHAHGCRIKTIQQQQQKYLLAHSIVT